MIRTQIQLTEEQARRLRRVARERGISMAEMIRRCVDKGLGDQAPSRSESYARASELLGRFPDREEAPDLATEHDRFLEEVFE